MLSIIALGLLACIPLCASHGLTPMVFTFGDSVVDTGNQALVTPDYPANRAPYGQQFGKPTGRTSNGRLLIDFIMERIGYENRPILTPNGTERRFSHGANFAFGYSTVLPLVPEYQGYTLTSQLSYYKQLFANASMSPNITRVPLGQYYVFIGGYDVILYFQSPEVRKAYNLTTFRSAYVGVMEKFITEIYTHGARNIIVATIPPVDCAPIVKSLFSWTQSDCVPQVKRFVTLVNDALTSRVRSLRTSLKNATILLVKSDFLRKVIANPGKFGFDGTKSACCGGGLFNGVTTCGTGNYTLCSRPRDTFFFDYAHPNEKAHRLIADRIWRGGQGAISPYNLRELIRLKPYA